MLLNNTCEIFHPVEVLGQVFTPQSIVQKMLALQKNHGSVLEPACGNGAFSKHFSNGCFIEFDKEIAPPSAIVQDFFDLPTSQKFDTIIGNPPYVRFQDIMHETKEKLNLGLFDERTNLYLFFIEKCVRHLNPNGELIFITPRDFLKATSAIQLNKFLFNQGTITDFIELGDQKVFEGVSPNCVIWRFEKGNYSRIANGNQRFTCHQGQLLFTSSQYPVKFSDVFYVKVGAVSGLDAVFEHKVHGNMEFVCSKTGRNGKTKRMIYNQKSEVLFPFKEKLLARKIKPFNEKNWWTWGRNLYHSNKKRIYVNCKTRQKRPFFLHPLKNYDGSVLAIFPKNQESNLDELCEALNNVNWQELGFVCDGRYLFSQKSLENSLLPEFFNKYF